MADAQETTPLLRSDDGSPNDKQGDGLADKVKSVLSPANRILLAGFLMAFTLGITQVPIIYVFRLMECEVFYSHHPPFAGPPSQRCLQPDINAGTASQVSLLGMSTSFFGVLNLFVCGWFIKLWGPRWAFASQAALLGLRVSTQVLAVSLGGRAGIIVFQATQAIGIVGGPAGYQLVVNTAISETVAPEKRTAVFGRLQGAIMLGVAFGFLLGGVLGEVYNIRRPFETAFFLYVASTFYGALFMPTVSPEVLSQRRKQSKGIKEFFAPLRIISSRRYRLQDGKVIRNYGLVMLALGIFLGVLATGYAPILLQLYGTAAFSFKTTENGALMFGNALIRGLFLILVFPKIISSGRAWLSGSSTRRESPQSSDREDIPTEPGEFEVAAGQDAPQEPVKPPGAKGETAGIEFDLLFVRWSLVVDSIVTAIAGFSKEGWQVYMAPAAKGVITGMCRESERQDALGAITLVESAATLSTQGLFGVIFAALSEAGQPRLTFFCNAAIALIGSATLFFARLPPANSERVDEPAAAAEVESTARAEGEREQS